MMNYSVRISERVVSRLKRRPCPRHHLRVASIGSVSTEHFHATQHALWVAHRSKFECPTSEMGRMSRAFSWSMKLRVTVREMKEGPSGSAIMGFVSRVTPVQTALRNCTGDEGGPFGFGEIPKDGGKVRVLSIPAIRDRVVQGALKLILEPIFEADFQPGSFGYRPKKTAHEAVDRVAQAIVQCKTRVIDFDLRSYFDNVQH